MTTSWRFLERLLGWAEQHRPLISITAAVALYASPAAGHYIPALVQEALLIVWLGEPRAMADADADAGWRMTSVQLPRPKQTLPRMTPTLIEKALPRNAEWPRQKTASEWAN
eukprot:s5894_g5.t1